MSFFSSNNTAQNSSTFWKKYHFFILFVAAIIIKQLPLVSIPFNWLESYFHEISHGLAAILTGGKVLRIQLFANGAGLCTTQGGISFVISFAGYAGATLWGWGKSFLEYTGRNKSTHTYDRFRNEIEKFSYA